jgi:SAM-dependent methyltransferase
VKMVQSFTKGAAVESQESGVTSANLQGPETFTFLSVLMPIHNDVSTLRAVVARVLRSPVSLPMELVCVDAGSRDGSANLLDELAEADDRIRVIRQPTNTGPGAALREAIRHMRGDVAIIQDADIEYDPADFPALLGPMLQGKADAVFGSRFAATAQRRVLGYWSAAVNKALTWIFNILNDVNLTDIEARYKVVRADVLRQIPLKNDGVGVGRELSARLAQWNLRLFEVPVNYHRRTDSQRRQMSWKDAVSAVWCLLKCRFIDTRFTTHDGYHILQSVRYARRFNKWMLRQFDVYIGQRVLEAGCGIGNFTELLLGRQRLICVDNDQLYIEMIRSRFSHLTNLRVLNANLADPAICDDLSYERLETVICLNVLEHISSDQQVLRTYSDVLVPGGRVVILVPAHPALYSECDKALGHERRYTRAELESKIEAAGFEVESIREFNRLGLIGWSINKLRRRADLSPREMRTFELLLPLAKVFERLQLWPGLSLIVVGRKPLTTPANAHSVHLTGQAVPLPATRAS